LNRRELAGWIGLATLAIAVMAACAVVGWSLLPRERRLALGAQSLFPVDRPETRAVDPGIHVFVVNLRGQLFAWDMNAPVEKGTRCFYKWVPTNHRFEDPCSGDKWCLDGTVADDRNGPARTLDSYRLTVDANGIVWLYPDQLILGTPAPANTPGPPPPDVQGGFYYCSGLP
jgi:hypothetical protein